MGAVDPVDVAGVEVGPHEHRRAVQVVPQQDPQVEEAAGLSCGQMGAVLFCLPATCVRVGGKGRASLGRGGSLARNPRSCFQRA